MQNKKTQPPNIGTQKPDPKQAAQDNKRSTTPVRTPTQIPGFDPSKYVKPGLTAEDVLKIKECFDIFDYDKSGAITPQELKNAIVALDMNKSAEEILNLIQDLDQDANSSVEFEEFLQIFGFTGDITDEDVLKDLFNQFDTQQKGLISVDDFKTINDLVGERYTEQEIREMVEFADKDKDGFINWEEFQSVVLKEAPQAS